MTTGTVLIEAIVPLLVLLVAWLMPSLTGPTLPFGVRVPASHAHAPVIAAQRAAYRRWVGGAGGVLLAGWVAWALWAGGADQVVPAALGGPAMVAVCAVGLVRAHRAIRAAKRRERWYEGVRQVVVADTALRTDPVRLPWRWAVPALLVPVATAVAGIVRYPSLPARLPVHYDAQGHADRFAARTVGSAFAPVIAQAGVTALIVLLLWLSLRSRPDLDPADPAAGAARYRRFAVRTAAAVLVLAACVDLALLAVAWQSWNGTGAFSPAAVLAPVAAGLLVVLAVAVRTGQGGSRLPADGAAGPTRTGPAPAPRDDDAHWRGAGLFYVNREDPAVLVPKRFGIGWTVNFGNPRSLLLLLPLAGLVVLPAVLIR